MAQTFKLACVVALACYVTTALKPGEGTPLDIQNTFIERCKNYSTTRPKLWTSASDVNCDNLWSSFISVWRNRPSCGKHIFTYDELFQNLAQKLPQDKLLFWSGPKDLAQKLSDEGRSYVTLEDTIIGSVVDSLIWCGSDSSEDGINYTTCPKYRSCAAEPMFNFWQAASKWFASQAVGEVSVLLYGSDPSRKAYNKSSMFRSVEVPNLQTGTVTKLTAFIVHDLGKAKIEKCPPKPICDPKRGVQEKKIECDCCDNPKENCPSNSICDLKRDVLEKKMSFECYDNPTEVKLLLCLKSPHHPECAQQSAAVIPGHFMHGSSMWARLTSATSMATLLMISFMCM